MKKKTKSRNNYKVFLGKQQQLMEIAAETLEVINILILDLELALPLKLNRHNLAFWLRRIIFFCNFWPYRGVKPCFSVESHIFCSFSTVPGDLLLNSFCIGFCKQVKHGAAEVVRVAVGIP